MLAGSFNGNIERRQNSGGKARLGQKPPPPAMQKEASASDSARYGASDRPSATKLSMTGPVVPTDV